MNMSNRVSQPDGYKPSRFLYLVEFFDLKDMNTSTIVMWSAEPIQYIKQHAGDSVWIITGCWLLTTRGIKI